MRTSFEIALNLLKQGKRIAREGWNGKGMYLELQTPDETSKMNLPYAYIVMPGSISETGTEPAKLVPWLCSQTDLLANDWYEVTTQ